METAGRAAAGTAGGVLPARALVVVRLLAAAVGEVDPECPERAGEWLVLVPHVRAALEVAGAGVRRDSGLGGDDLADLMLRERHADARRFLGQAAGAEAEYRPILDVRLRVQGPGHPSTLTTREAIRRLAR